MIFIPNPSRIPLLVLLLLFCFGSSAQNGHYWAQQYGTRSMLLSGSVIGGAEDLGAVYYNPARIAQIENPSFLLSAEVYQWRRVKLENYFGEDKSKSGQKFEALPNLAAGTFKLKFLEGHQFAYAIFTRTNARLSFTFQDEIETEVFTDAPGEEIFGADIDLSVNDRSRWFGFSWAYPFNDKWSIGASLFGTQDVYDKKMRINLHALTIDDRVGIYNFYRSFKLEQYGVLFKFGASFQSEKIDFGITLGTPQIKLFGNGDFRYEEFLSGMSGISGTPDSYTTGSQDDLDVKARNPWALGAGFSIPLKRSTFFCSLELFSPIGEYSMIRAQDFSSQSNPAEIIGFRVVDNRELVFNGGIGAEMRISEKVSGYLSFSTDFSPYERSDIKSFYSFEQEVSNRMIFSDFYHAGGGIVIRIPQADITLGATWTGASESIERPVNFPEEGNPESILDSGNTAQIKTSRWRLVFSFSLPALDKIKNKFQRNTTGLQ